MKGNSRLLAGVLEKTRYFCEDVLKDITVKSKNRKRLVVLFEFLKNRILVSCFIYIIIFNVILLYNIASNFIKNGKKSLSTRQIPIHSRKEV